MIFLKELKDLYFHFYILWEFLQTLIWVKQNKVTEQTNIGQLEFSPARPFDKALPSLLATIVHCSHLTQPSGSMSLPPCQPVHPSLL